MPQAFTAADLNADGKPDLAVADSLDTQIGVMLNNCLP